MSVYQLVPVPIRDTKNIEGQKFHDLPLNIDIDVKNIEQKFIEQNQNKKDSIIDRFLKTNGDRLQRDLWREINLEMKGL